MIDELLLKAQWGIDTELDLPKRHGQWLNAACEWWDDFGTLQGWTFQMGKDNNGERAVLLSLVFENAIVVVGPQMIHMMTTRIYKLSDL